MVTLKALKPYSSSQGLGLLGSLLRVRGSTEVCMRALLSAGSSQGLGLLRAPSKETGIFTKKVMLTKTTEKRLLSQIQNTYVTGSLAYKNMEYWSIQLPYMEYWSIQLP